MRHRITGEKLKARNPHINVEVFKEFLTAENAEKTVRNFDYIIDGSDNFATRYLLNDIAVFQKKPLINGSVYRFHGQVSVFNSMTGPCYRCLYPDPPRPEEIGSCVSGGVMGVVPGIVGMIQAGETIKMICETGAYLSGKLLVLNILNWDFLTVKISKNPACKICGPNPEITALIDYENFCGEGESDIPGEFEISAPELESKLKTKGRFRVLDIRESTEADICRLENSELVPQREINHYLSRLNPEEEIILYCRSGIRSARAISVFREHGFTNVRHLRGGILAWIDEVDPSLARY
jgi:rhodanese-related sulfurtransferase